jgi:hypothetical protein
MFVCLSSGYRPRYLRDIARSLALPRGTSLAFRYERRWIPTELQERLAEPKQRKKLHGADVVIAYIEQTDENKPIEIVPCRYARLAKIASVGHTVSLELEVRELAYARDLADFNKYLQAEYPTLVPRRTAAGIEGAYWFEVNALPGVERATGEAIWEELVAQLAPRRDFANERFFYSVQGIVDIRSDKTRRVRRNLVRLRPGRDYELRLYHYYPKDDDVQAEVQASITGVPVEFTATPELLLDSRYDLKRIPFRSGAPVPGERGVLTLRRRRVGEEKWEWDLDLGLLVRAAWFRQVLFGLVVAFFLAVPPIVAAYQNSNLSNHAQHVITVAAILSSLLAGITAAFGLRRSL